MPISFFPTMSAFSNHVSFFCHIGKNARILAFFIGKKMPEPWLFYPRKKCQHSGIFLRGVGNRCRKKPTLVEKSRHLSEKPDIAKKNLEFFFKKLYLFFQKIFMFILSLKCIYNKKNIMYF